MQILLSSEWLPDKERAGPVSLETDQQILQAILDEVNRAKRKHPRWPEHIVARAGIVCEEAGELIREAVNFKYERESGEESRQQGLDAMRKEAIQTAATAIRFLQNLK